MINKTIFFEKIENADTIAIVGHIRPDGDCCGSCLGLYNYLTDNYKDKKITVYLEEIPDAFAFLNGALLIKHEADSFIYDLGISLDCGDTDRHGEFADVFKNAKDSICIDHHKSNQGFGDYFYCAPDASSTAEVLMDFLDIEKISKACAECLYLGIVHDTGVFKYASTSEKTMTFAGKLISKGVDTQYIIDETFYRVNYNQNRMTGKALMNSKLHLDGKVISTVITLDMFKEFNTTKKDTEGIVDKIRVTDGVEVAVFVYQLDDNRYKFSLRSISYVDVSKISVAFGGGGHMRAAGFDVSGELSDIFDRVLAMIKEQL